MQIFHIIMSIYMLFLSLVPCSDEEKHASDKEANIEFAVHSDSDQGDNGESHEDNCTPFCTCNCCGASGVELLFSAYQINPQPLSFIEKKSFFVETNISEFNHSIWQPPKV